MRPDQERKAYRMETLAVLPVFFKLRGKQVLVAGGGDPAAWKAELLAAAGARVSVIADLPGEEMSALAAGEAQVTLLRRRWAPDDLAGVALAIGGFDDNDEAARFAEAARGAGVPVNVIDKPAFCDFQFGTVVSRSPLVIGISTDGAAPVFGQAIRTRIEALLPQNLRRWAEAARDWRPDVQARGLDFQARRRFWEAFSDRALRLHADPTPADQAACFDAVERSDALAPTQVTLVGAGPGRPGTLTLDAVGALQTASVVIHDSDVDELTIGLARREARKIANDAEANVARTVATLAAQGESIAWLGTGDPSVCSRWLTRTTLLNAMGINTAAIRGGPGCPRCPENCLDPAFASTSA